MYPKHNSEKSKESACVISDKNVAVLSQTASSSDVWSLDITCDSDIVFTIESLLAEYLKKEFTGIRELQGKVKDYEESVWGGALERTRRVENILLSIRNGINDMVGAVPAYIKYDVSE